MYENVPSHLHFNPIFFRPLRLITQHIHMQFAFILLEQLFSFILFFVSNRK